MSNSIAGVPSIVGEQFPDFIVKQIEQRQKVYGSLNRTPQQLQYMHAKTATCALASSIDIKSFDRFKNTALADYAKDFGETKLAQMLVLEGGVREYKFDDETKSLNKLLSVIINGPLSVELVIVVVPFNPSDVEVDVEIGRAHV